MSSIQNKLGFLNFFNFACRHLFFYLRRAIKQMSKNDGRNAAPISIPGIAHALTNATSSHRHTYVAIKLNHINSWVLSLIVIQCIVGPVQIANGRFKTHGKQINQINVQVIDILVN